MDWKIPGDSRVGPTDGPTDRRTDKASYRDARTHLKRCFTCALTNFIVCPLSPTAVEITGYENLCKIERESFLPLPTDVAKSYLLMDGLRMNYPEITPSQAVHFISCMNITIWQTSKRQPINQSITDSQTPIDLNLYTCSKFDKHLLDSIDGWSPDHSNPCPSEGPLEKGSAKKYVTWTHNSKIFHLIFLKWLKNYFQRHFFHKLVVILGPLCPWM